MHILHKTFYSTENNTQVENVSIRDLAWSSTNSTEQNPSGKIDSSQISHPLWNPRVHCHVRLEAFTVTELDKIFSGNKPNQLWTKAHHHSPDDGNSLRNVGLLSTTDTACPRGFYQVHCHVCKSSPPACGKTRPCVTFCNMLVLYGEDLLAPTQPPNYRATPYLLSTAVYSTHSQLPSISGDLHS
jgi:hypothetical protein